MDNKHLNEMYKNLEKQSEVLMESYRSMTHELHRLKVEEEMLMRKFYELMTAQGIAKKNKTGEDASKSNVNSESTAIVCHPSNDQSTALVSHTSTES